MCALEKSFKFLTPDLWGKTPEDKTLLEEHATTLMQFKKWGNYYLHHFKFKLNQKQRYFLKLLFLKWRFISKIENIPFKTTFYLSISTFLGTQHTAQKIHPHEIC